jgi:hypothetical protein
MLQWMFQKDQEATLEDHKATAVKLRYNTKWRHRNFDFNDEEPEPKFEDEVLEQDRDPTSDEEND